MILGDRMNLSNIKPVRVRFAPSPTGPTHLGSGRTALYNYLLARQTNGHFILRIEDTDQKRFIPEAEQELIDSLHWLGLDWDEGPDVGGPHNPYRQSERKDIYHKYALQLIESGYAYYCFCSPEELDRVRKQQAKMKSPSRYSGKCRRLDPDEATRRAAAGEPHVIRFKMPQEGITTVRDLLRGEITFDYQNLDDYIIVKSDGLALYHLAAMVDDHLMGITHVIRGSEWLSTLPLHAQIIHAFGWEEPVWVHLSVFLKPSGKGKMSKRESSHLIKDGYSIFIQDLANLGYLPEAVLNWIALMGWSYDDHTELFTLEDLVSKFNLNHLNPSPAAINFSKLDYFNGQHIRNLSIPALAERIQPYFDREGYQTDPQKLLKITSVIRERIITLDDAPRIAGVYFQDEVHPDPQNLIGKHMTAAESAEVVRQTYAILASLPELTPQSIEPPMRNLVDGLGLSAGQVFGIIRVAITGQTVSPPLFESMEIIGKNLVLSRLENANRLLNASIFPGEPENR
jgi:glutamyl-tRNA synthetase